MEFSKPMCLTNLMVRRPCTIILTGNVIMLAISVLVAFMGWLEPNLTHDRDFLVWGDPYVSNMDKTILVERMPISSTSNSNEDGSEDFIVNEVPLQSQVVPAWTVMLIYSSASAQDDIGGNIWTKDALLSIREFEKDV